jgi:importin-5
MGTKSLNEEQMASVIKIMDKYLTEHFNKQEQRHEQRKDEDYDDELEDQLLDEARQSVTELTLFSFLSGSY